MKAGVRLKLFATLLTLIVGAGLLGGVYLEQRLRGWYEPHLTEELSRRVAMARELVEIAPDLETAAIADSLADRLGESSRTRITIIEQGGKVIGDSKIESQALKLVENHANRPEFVQALKSGQGSSVRHSNTLQMPMLYVAVPYRRVNSRGVVRVAMALSEVESAVEQLRLVLAVAGLVGLVLAVAVSGMASHLASRPLRRLVNNVRGISSANGGSRMVPVVSDDELGKLAGSFNALVRELEGTLESLASERDRLSTIVQGMSEAVIALDPSHHVTLLNPAARDLLALPERNEGKSLPELMADPDLGQWLQGVLESGGGAQETELSMPRGRIALARAALLKTTGGLVLVMLDITHMRRLEEVRRDFVASVSHELRTPISVIQANAETLLDGAMYSPEHGPKFLDAIYRNAQRLTRLVSDLLDLARIEAGKFPFEPKSLAVSRSVQSVVRGLYGLAEAKSVSLEIEVADALQVWADDNALEQVLVNLVENAVKYTSEGGLVTIRAFSTSSANGIAEVALEVSDNGPGIDEKHWLRVFERFYRVDPGRSRDMGGTGLGLAIVKHLVHGMAGRISLDRAPTGGARFRILLPEPRVHSS